MSIQTLVEKIKEKGNPTVAGLDARLEYIPQHISGRNMMLHGETLRAAAASVVAFNCGLIDALCDIVPAVKPQAAYYELLGSYGAMALKETIDYAHAKGMYVIGDIKRNDIGATATAYAEAYLGKTRVGDTEIAPYGCDSVTVNGVLGTDCGEPLLKVCRGREKSLFMLVKTSNPSSGELQNRDMEGKPLYARMAEMVAKWGEGLDTPCGYNQVGAVVGATYPEEQKIIRELLPKSYFLVPGYGAQGATAKDIANAFNDDGLGAIVNSSRGIMCAWKKTGNNGEDYKCGREAQYMRAFAGKKYNAMYMVSGLLNTQGGPKRSANAEVLDTQGTPLPHLYSAGECGGITVCMYQGGTNIAECITFGRIAGKNAAAVKDALPTYTVEAVESAPAQPGDIDDLVGEEETYETADNQYIGKAQGMDDEIVVRVTVDDGKISQVEVLKQNETEGIGVPATEQLPEKFVGLDTEEAINAVDGISGATITSNALKQAVVNALLQAKG